MIDFTKVKDNFLVFAAGFSYDISEEELVEKYLKETGEDTIYEN